MNRNEAVTALEGIGRTEKKLAERARWPFHRHAMFGLAEGLIVAGVAQPTSIGASMTAVAMALVAICIVDDRRRHGMFISGWQRGGTLPLTIAVVAIVVAALAASLWLRDGENAQPLGYLLGAATFALCTGASLLWQKIYRAELTQGRGQ